MKFGGSSLFVCVVLAIILLLIFGCVFGIYCFGRKKENFGNGNGCAREINFQDPNYLNERFFHYDNIDKIVSSDPVHVPREVVDNALMSGEDVSCGFGDSKKKSQ